MARSRRSSSRTTTARTRTRSGMGARPWSPPTAAGSPGSAGGAERVLMRLADRSRKARKVAQSMSVGELRFSPDSKSLGIVPATRLWVYDIHARESVKAASGNIRGFSFSPDSESVAFGTSGKTTRSTRPPTCTRSRSPTGHAADHARPQVAEPAVGRPAGSSTTASPRQRGAVLQPVRDPARRRQPAPDHRAHDPDPSSGLIPLELSANGKRLIAEFVGQDTSVGFAVNPKTGKVRALSRDSENGFVAANLTADGKTVLGATGGATRATSTTW